MKKILIINTKYKIHGGEDSNISEEINILKKNYKVDYLEFDNSQKINIFDILCFLTGTNLKSNKIIIKKVNKFSPDIIYIHNTWFKVGTSIFNKLLKFDIPIYLKLHNFRYDCTKSFFAKKHVKIGEICKKCGFNNKNNKKFNKYYDNSILKSILINIYGILYFRILNNSRINLVVLTNFHKTYLNSLNLKNNIYVSSNPIDISKLNNSYNHKSNYVVYAGVLSKPKGLYEILDTWKKYDTQLILKIIGEGEEFENLKNKYSNLSKVIFTGKLNNQLTLREISNARAVITATKMFEGQPRLLCEASSLKIPSIYPSFGGMDEFFPTNYSLSFKQYDYEDLLKVIQILDDIKTLQKISYQVFEFAKTKFLNNYSFFELEE